MEEKPKEKPSNNKGKKSDANDGFGDFVTSDGAESWTDFKDGSNNKVFFKIYYLIK